MRYSGLGFPSLTPGAPLDHPIVKFTATHRSSDGPFGDPPLNMSGHPRVTGRLKNISNTKTHPKRKWKTDFGEIKAVLRAGYNSKTLISILKTVGENKQVIKLGCHFKKEHSKKSFFLNYKM